MRNKNLVVLLCAVIPAFFLGGSEIANADLVEFRLTGNAGEGLLPGNVTPGTSSSGYGGEGELGISLEANTLTIDILWGSENGFGDLTGEITNLHLHGPTDDLPPDAYSQTGPMLINLGTSQNFNSSATGGGLTATYFISNSDISALLEGRTYINVHTEMYPKGELRGYLAAVPEPGCAGLTGILLMGFSCNRRRIR